MSEPNVYYGGRGGGSSSGVGEIATNGYGFGCSSGAGSYAKGPDNTTNYIGGEPSYCSDTGLDSSPADTDTTDGRGTSSGSGAG